MALDESMRRNPTQPVQLLEREGHLRLVSSGTQTQNCSLPIDHGGTVKFLIYTSTQHVSVHRHLGYLQLYSEIE